MRLSYNVRDMKSLKSLLISGKEVLPLIEGGKGISITNGQTAGAWAKAGAIGTFSGVFGDFYNEEGTLIPLIFQGKTRVERNIELVKHTIKAGISQARIAYDVAKNNGRIHMNLLWGLSSIEETLSGILEKAKDIIHGVTVGAGLPFRLAEISAKHGVYYYPIVSSARTFNILWKRAYSNFRDWLGGVVYEDPWKAGGHNGISNSENPNNPENPYLRVRALRNAMKEHGIGHLPIIMAGGVWFLRDWKDWINNPELGNIAFQFGTRPLLTVESPISDQWKKYLLTLEEKEIVSNHFSPTGFYSIAVKNQFIKELEERSLREVRYSQVETKEKNVIFIINKSQHVYLSVEDFAKIKDWMDAGFSKSMLTPDSTIIFTTEEKYKTIKGDQMNCSGCIAYCKFSNWSENEQLSKGRIPDPRSYCIKKTLDSIAHGGDVETNLMFSGTLGYLFSKDPFYANGFIPTIKQLIDRILTGD